MSSHLPTAAVIGAGCSGITALKGLVEQGIEATCFEASDRVGGNWVFENKNGMSACYRDLHINTSRLRMAYSDYAMPEDYPDYPRHDQIAAYFDDYVDHFGLRGRIRFETRIERAERAEDGTWELTLEDGVESSASTRSSSPTATTGTRACPSPRSPARTPSRACRCTRTPT